MSWRPEHRKDLGEVSGPIRQVVPRGIFGAYAARRKQARVSEGIECGSCHAVIYKPDKEFDREAFEAAKKEHYSASPTCKKASRSKH
jgi:hypothetical protein